MSSQDGRKALRIARCEFTMRFERSADEARLADQRIIDGMDLWQAEGADEVSRGRREWVRHVRLSDAFFVWSRHAAKLEGVDEVLWQPNEASGAAGGV